MDSSHLPDCQNQQPVTHTGTSTPLDDVSSCNCEFFLYRSSSSFAHVTCPAVVVASPEAYRSDISDYGVYPASGLNLPSYPAMISPTGANSVGPNYAEPSSVPSLSERSDRQVFFVDEYRCTSGSVSCRCRLPDELAVFLSAIG